MVVYYQGPCVLVTDRAFEVWCPYRQRFAIQELQDVYIVETGLDRTAVTATVITLVALVVMAAIRPLLTTPETWLLSGAVVTTLASISAGCWLVNRTERELRATYRGMHVLLYQSRDAQTFGQVRRALARALEADRLW